MNESMPTVILGGGFAGLFAALHLCHRRYPRPIVLIDQAERFIFKPLLYELLSGEMSENQVWPRYEELFDCSGIAFVQDTVEKIDLHQRQVRLASGLCYSYGNLLLSLGSSASYFGTQGAKENSWTFRTGDDATDLRKHLRDRLQKATQTKDPKYRRSLLSVAIIGAGPAGVEMAVTLADLLPGWYRQLGGNPQEVRIVIVNRSAEILKGDINSHLRETAQKSLKQRAVPVELLLNASVSGVFRDRVEYKQDDQVKILSTATTIWTAGNAVHPLIKNLPVPEENRDRSCRLRVTPTLQLRDFPEVFAGGDCAVLDEPLPATAQVAYQQGAAIAHNLQAISGGGLLKPATVNLRGTLMKLGLGEGAVNLLDRFAITGKAGHLIRHGTYLELLPSPVHNFKATVEWLTDELFTRHSSVVEPTRKRSRFGQVVGPTAAALVLLGSGLLAWRVVQPEQFEKAWRSIGIPNLIDGQRSEPESE